MAWTGEASGYDAITLMAIIASHTERLHVGSAVVPVQTRTPVLLGQSAATLNHMAPDRVVLGIGLSSRVIVGDWHGLAFAPALQQIREAVQIIRMVAAGERVTFEGKFYRVKNFRLAAPPPSKPVRVVLAALGPEMLKLAGEIADGVVLNWIPPETVPASIGHLEAGARKVGRTLGDFEIASFIRTCVTDDVLAAREVVVTEPLRLDRDAGDLVDARRLLPLGVRSGKSRDNRCDDAELHALPLLQRWVTNRVYSAGF